jgi:hypothetical protein
MARRSSALQRVPKGQPHPNASYENTSLWKAIDAAITDLVENRDLIEAEYHEYVVGYICKIVTRRRNTILHEFGGR